MVATEQSDTMKWLRSLSPYPFVRKPLAEQRAELAAMASRETATRQEVILETRLRKAHGALSKSIADGNGLLAARDMGVLGELQPIRFEGLFSLARRVAQAKVASEHFGVAMINPILPAEAEHIGE